MKEYIEEFYKLDIRSGHVDDEVEKVARYINGLRASFQDEISYFKMDSVKEACQYALKYEEILVKTRDQRQRGICGIFQ